MVVKYEWPYKCKVCGAKVVAREYHGLEGGHYIEPHDCPNLTNWMIQHPKGDFLEAQFTIKAFVEAG